jgi:PAS domain S-box-containing protein
MRPLRALIVEDSASDASLMVAELHREGWAVDWRQVETASAMRGALEERQWDVILSDCALPAFSAQRALAILHETTLDVPFIIVSGSISEDDVVAAMRAGASDYMSKDTLGRLGPAVERALREQAAREAHRSAEVARREAEMRFRRIFDSGIAGVTVADASGRITEANDTFLEMIGYTRAELEAGKVDARRITPAEWQPQHARVLQQLHTRGRIRPFEREYLRKDGSRAPVLAGAALLDETRVLTVLTDLSLRKSLEEQLRHAQKMDAVGRLAGGVAHDFNNLLSVILSYSELMLGDMSADDPLRDDLEQIRIAGKRAADLTGRLLMFSRQQVVEPRTIDLREVLFSVEKMLHRLVGEDVDLTCVVEPGLGMVRADAGLMEQVIMNLAVNARDAMPTGGRLTMEARNVSLGDGYVRSHIGAALGPHVVLSVTDTGTGMDEATMQRIFEPYFTTKEQGKGTGLGLSTVFGIVEQAGGHVAVSSELGLGTRFDVYLPRVKGGVADPAWTLRPLATRRGTETVLLTEDEEQVRVVARGILERHGYQVLEARSGEEALRLAEQHAGPIHLLLTDVVMPRMSGPALADQLRQTRPSVRVLCMSGYTDDATVRHGVFAAQLAYLQKPLTVETLTRKVREVLDGDLPVA